MAQDGDQAIATTLLTGFLGSGKTTVLGALVRHPSAGRIAAIINEFGDVDLDHDLIEASSEDVVLLGNGCLCCSIRGNLADTLRDLYQRRAAGAARFDRVVIETSGLVDPTPVLRLLLADAFLADHFRLEAVVTVVDALHGTGQLDRHQESVRQAALADRLLVSKTDLAPANRVEALERRLRRLNPVAEIIRVVAGQIEPDRLLAPAPARREVADAAEDCAGGAHDHDHDAPLHDPSVAAVSARTGTPLQPGDVDALMAALRGLKGPGLLRAKAILQIAGASRPLVIHAVQDMVHEPVPLGGTAPFDAGSRLVVITSGVAREAVLAHLPPVLREAAR